MQLRTTQTTMFPPPPLTVVGVFKTLQDIANMQGKEASWRAHFVLSASCVLTEARGGPQSTTKKKDTIKRMLVSCRESEARSGPPGRDGPDSRRPALACAQAKFIIRCLQGKMRIGLQGRALRFVQWLTQPLRPAELTVQKALARAVVLTPPPVGM
jgi:hypothetical protein